MKNVKLYDYQCCSEMNPNECCIINLGYAFSLMNDPDAIRNLKVKYPNARFMVDLKITGEDVLNAKLAYDAGADIVSVMGIASDETLRDAELIAEENCGEVLIDMTGVREINDRLETAAIDGFDYAYIPEGTPDEDMPIARAAYGSRLYSWLTNYECRLETAI